MTAGLVASCSLGLDESKIGAGDDGGLAEDSSTIDNAAADARDTAPPPINPEGGVCTKDEDCKGTKDCVTARCDVPRKACVFTVCRETACNSAACNGGTTCAAPRPYKYRAAQFPVAGPIGCGGALGRCFAAVYPFVFVGTPIGVTAYSAVDPQATTPTVVPLTGLDFVPVQMVASGSRVFFLGPPQGTTTTARVPIAYVDVPPDPFATSIPVQTILATYPRSKDDAIALFPRGSDTALLVNSTGPNFPSAKIEPPLTEPLTLTPFTITSAIGDVPYGVSGTRLVMGQNTGTGVTQFAFVPNAGDTGAAATAAVPIPTATPGIGPFYFAQSADGAFAWSYVSLTTAPPGPPPPTVRAARVYLLTAGGEAAFDPASGVDVEVYPNLPLGTPAAGPIAMLDANRAMVLTSLPANPGNSTNVSFVTRTPLGLVKNGDNTPRRSPINLPVTQLAAAGSNGLGYVLAVDPAAPTTPSVYVFDPGCAP
ncbi:MAG: hypothetical protein JST00_29000 [Deltaproteobacteria bacterium]|nr:hypothetical protein [Deltaproteobacteria bacterium]